MAKIEINPNTGRPYNVAEQNQGRFRGMITTPEHGTVAGPTVSDQLLAKRHAEVIRALLSTGSTPEQARSIVKGILS